jgi:hypothetical protein
MAFIFKTLNVRGLPSFHLIDLFEKYLLVALEVDSRRKEVRKEGRKGGREGRRDCIFKRNIDEEDLKSREKLLESLIWSEQKMNCRCL